MRWRRVCVTHMVTTAPQQPSQLMNFESFVQYCTDADVFVRARAQALSARTCVHTLTVGALRRTPTSTSSRVTTAASACWAWRPLSRCVPALSSCHDAHAHCICVCCLPQHPIEEEVYDESLFETDRDLRAVRKWFSADFRRTFAEGVEAYRKGDWHTARRLLETTLTDPTLPTRDGDGPSRTLLEYMSRFKYKAPRSWAGNRALTSK